MREEWLNRIALTWANRTRPRQVRALLDRHGSATEVVARYGEMVNQQAMEHARKELDFIEKHEIGTYFYKDTNYPYRLASCVDAPIILYTKGNVNLDNKHMLSVVGTRMPTERGKDWCRRLVLDLAAQVPDLTIVSGLAYGIDVVAHRAAIEAGIPTIIVPAHGLDRIYPAVHRQVAVQSLDKGGIATEYTCGTEPERFNFVARNRIVAGLSDAVVIVESKRKGGSLITADMAVDYGRDVFALPGRVEDECSAGCNDLIKRNKAHLIEHAEDLIKNMQWVGLVVLLVNRGPEKLCGNFKSFGKEFPCERNCLLLEIISEREVSEHFKVGTVTRGMSNSVKVGSSYALLAGTNSVFRRNFFTRKVLFHRSHSRVDKQK